MREGERRETHLPRHKTRAGPTGREGEGGQQRESQGRRAREGERRRGTGTGEERERERAREGRGKRQGQENEVECRWLQIYTYIQTVLLQDSWAYFAPNCTRRGPGSEQTCRGYQQRLLRVLNEPVKDWDRISIGSGLGRLGWNLVGYGIEPVEARDTQ